MRVRVWVWLGLLAFMGGSLLRLGVETGSAGFTMFGMIAFLLIGLLALREVASVQTRTGWRRLRRVLRSEAGVRPVLRLPAGGQAGVRYLVQAGSTWVALSAETSSEAGLWALVRPALLGRGRRLRHGASALPLGEAEVEAMPALVLLRRKVRERERALGEGLGVRLVNPEDLPGLFQEVAAREQDVAGNGDAGPAADRADGRQAVARLAQRLGAEVLSERGNDRPRVEATTVNAYPAR